MDHHLLSGLLLTVISLLLLKLSKAQTMCRGRMGEQMCSSTASNSNGWFSCLSAEEINTTQVTLSWRSHPNIQEDYQLYWRLRIPMAPWMNTSALNAEVSDDFLPNNLSYQLGGLLNGTEYDIRICVYRTESFQPSSPPSRRCGSCRLVLTTYSPVQLVRATVERLPDNRVRYTCAADGVPPPTVSWSVHRVSEGGRAPLPEQGGFVLTTDSLENGVVSVLTFNSDNMELDRPACVMENNVSSIRIRVEDFVDTGDTAPGTPLHIILVSAIVPSAVITIIIAVIIIIFCVIFRRKQKRKMNVHVREANHYTNTAPLQLNTIVPATTEADTNALHGLLHTSLPKSMIVPSSSIKVSTVIGQGEFGVVYKGTLTRNNVQEVVAIKTLKGIFATSSEIQSFTEEITILQQFHHPNVMTLIGVCVGDKKDSSPSIILPFMAKGSLLDFLRKETHRLKPSADSDTAQIGAVEKNFVQICLQVAKGMEYLARQRFVHRDLAARNCMIDQNDQIRVGDFGLSEDIYARNYFKQSASDGVKLPVKWMSPESLKLGIFNEKTDMWSYGVTCWEVFSCGEIPYPGVHPQEVLHLLEDGQRLRKPKNPACSDTLYRVILGCWNIEPAKRKKFAEMCSILEYQLQTMSDYLDLNVISNTVFHQPSDNDYYLAIDEASGTNGDFARGTPLYIGYMNGQQNNDPLATENNLAASLNLKLPAARSTCASIVSAST